MMLAKSMTMIVLVMVLICSAQACTDWDVRLNGSVYYEGQAEICVNNSWSSVCSDSSWSVNEATVVCRQLGCSNDGSTVGRIQVNGTDFVHVYTINCGGQESSLLSCIYHYLLGDSCYSQSAVKITCQQASIRAPSDVSSSISRSTSITISWRPPSTRSSLCTETIEGYIANCTTDSGRVWQSSRVSSSTISTKVEDLFPYTTYNCCVRAYNQASQSVDICTNNIRTKPVPPTIPRNVTVTSITSTSAKINWLYPQYTNGTVTYSITCSNTDTRVRYPQSTSPSRLSSTRSSYIITGLHPFGNYSCQVSATNSVGVSESTITLQTQEAGSLHVWIVTRRSRSFQIQWNPLQVNHQNGIIIGYNINVTIVGSETRMDFRTNNTRITVSSLHPYYYYNCSVAAYTSVGTGHYTTQKIQTLEDIPDDTPSNVLIAGELLTSTSFQIKWNSPQIQLQNGIIRGYRVIITVLETGMDTNLDTPNTWITVSSLHPYYQYDYSVAAKTSVGYGPYTMSKRIQTLEDVPSGVPQNLTGTKLSTKSFKVKCSPPLPEHQNGVIQGYKFNVTEFNTGRNIQYSVAGNCELTISNLEPNFFYYFSAAAYTSVGEGPYTELERIQLPTGTGFTKVGISMIILAILLAGVLFGVCFYFLLKKYRHRYLSKKDDQDQSDEDIQDEQTEVQESDASKFLLKLIPRRRKKKNTIRDAPCQVELEDIDEKPEDDFTAEPVESAPNLPRRLYFLDEEFMKGVQDVIPPRRNALPTLPERRYLEDDEFVMDLEQSCFTRNADGQKHEAESDEQSDEDKESDTHSDGEKNKSVKSENNGESESNENAYQPLHFNATRPKDDRESEYMSLNPSTKPTKTLPVTRIQRSHIKNTSSANESTYMSLSKMYEETSPYQTLQQAQQESNM